MTAQSMTSQPRRPCRSVSRTVSSTARKNAAGIVPARSAPMVNVTPEPAAVGSTRSPIVATNGFSPSYFRSTAAPVPSGRSTQIVVDSRKPTSRR